MNRCLLARGPLALSARSPATSLVGRLVDSVREGDIALGETVLIVTGQFESNRPVPNVDIGVVVRCFRELGNAIDEANTSHKVRKPNCPNDRVARSRPF